MFILTTAGAPLTKTMHLNRLENESIFTIREAYRKTKNLALLWSMGKDSTVLLHLVRKAFIGRCPIPLVHIDTSYKIPEMIAWRDEYVKRHNLKLIVGMNSEALAKGMNPEMGRLTCCQTLKTEPLLDVIRNHEIQALLVGIRGDEEGSRSKEKVVSPRSSTGSWTYKEQPAEIWRYYNLHVPETVHLRIHPLLQWTEMDIWQYIEQEQLEILPLYMAKEGKRYRTLGCAPCTKSIDSTACSVGEIIDELQTVHKSERAGRAQDGVDHYALQQLRSKGYM
jgi:sulfate adenylyltransferase subunit 2